MKEKVQGPYQLESHGKLAHLFLRNVKDLFKLESGVLECWSRPRFDDSRHFRDRGESNLNQSESD
jgi:hypothetical protein